jgi:ABC-type lipoprotein export system ATPase subunit
MKNKQNIGLVSLDVPLISNLNVWVNIALIKQYHQNLSEEKAKLLVFQYLQKCGMEHSESKRTSALTNKERFLVMLLRAAMVRDAIIVIDRPFVIIPDVPDDIFIYDSLNIIDDSFKECYIFDFAWFKDRYRMINI